MEEIARNLPHFTLLQAKHKPNDRTSLAGPERNQLTIAQTQARDAANRDAAKNTTSRDVDQTNIGLLFQKIEKENL